MVQEKKREIVDFIINFINNQFNFINVLDSFTMNNSFLKVILNNK
jgi:hypothetical protein